MLRFGVLIIFLFITKTKTEDYCCERKVVNDITYSFVKKDKVETDEYGCLNSCIYKKEDDTSMYPQEFCFKSGTYVSECTEEAVPLGGCIGKRNKLFIYS